MTVPPTRLLPEAPLGSLAEYEDRGGGEAFVRAVERGPEWVVEQLEDAGLRGRGGGGFPTGAKWRSVASTADAGIRYVVANGAEGEPGTFKDRPLLRANPYQVLEGLLVAALTMGARDAFIALKASFDPELAAVERAVAELAAAGWLADVRIHIVRGPEEYLFGEEKALLEVIEGDEPLPRLFPPYQHGLFATVPELGWSASADVADDPRMAAANPTLVNNVETLANVPPILAEGPEAYRRLGTPDSPGTLIVTVSGDTVRAGFAELPMGTPLAAAIAAIGGGVPAGRSVKAVLSGVANAVLTADHLDAPISYEGMRAAGSGLGAAGFLVFDDRTDMVRVAHAVSRFLYVESCGQCPPCKYGSGEITAILEGILADGGTERELDLLSARLASVTDANRCYLGTQEQVVVSSLLQRFPEDLALDLTGVHTRPVAPITEIRDITADGRLVADERQARKRPDWTYADDTPVTIARRRSGGPPLAGHGAA